MKDNDISFLPRRSWVQIRSIRLGICDWEIWCVDSLGYHKSYMMCSFENKVVRDKWSSETVCVNEHQYSLSPEVLGSNPVNQTWYL